MAEILWTIPVTVVATIIGFVFSLFIASGWEARRRYLHLKAVVRYRNDLHTQLSEDDVTEVNIQVSGLLNYEEIRSIALIEAEEVLGDRRRLKGFPSEVVHMPWWKHWIPGAD